MGVMKAGSESARGFALFATQVARDYPSLVPLAAEVLASAEHVAGLRHAMSVALARGDAGAGRALSAKLGPAVGQLTDLAILLRQAVLDHGALPPA